MATVEASPGHHPPFSMTARRAPLANNPNAINSPSRPPVSLKRPRPYDKAERDVDTTRSPTKKRLLLDTGTVPLRKVHTRDDSDSRIFNGRDGEPTPFHQKLVATKNERSYGTTHTVEPRKEGHAADAETIKQWRRHYRRIFPQFVFYFENLPPDFCSRAKRQLRELDSREEKFFSKDVTHIITTRTIPDTAAAALASARNSHAQPRTINPSLLDKHEQADSNASQQRPRQALEIPPQRRSNSAITSTSTNDVLLKAMEMGIKIWALEKFERMMHTMFNVDTSTSPENQQKRRTHTTYVPTKSAREANLTQLLQEEKRAPLSRPPWSDIVPHQGIYVYVHDMDEKTRPVMYREYEKPARDQDGDWPMFRSVSKGRCPFVEEPDHAKQKHRERERKDKLADAARKQEQQPRTRAAVAAVEAAKGKETEISEKIALATSKDSGNRMPKPVVPASWSKMLEQPRLDRTTSGTFDSMPSLLGSTHANFRGLARNPGGEPLASGIQRSNATSAIRSQMISSTAANPVNRMGTTKEMYQLQRRVFEKPVVGDLRAVGAPERASAGRPTTRSQVSEKLTRIHEDEANTDDEHDAGGTACHGVQYARAQKESAKREPKPGYCENCKDKYDDFQTHIASKLHRKFAMSNEHFSELDNLLKELVRPIKSFK